MNSGFGIRATTVAAVSAFLVSAAAAGQKAPPSPQPLAKNEFTLTLSTKSFSGNPDGRFIRDEHCKPGEIMVNGGKSAAKSKKSQ